MTGTLAPPSLDDVRRARDRIGGMVVRTPRLRIPADLAHDTHLKLESLQPIGSFKIRGAANAMALAGRDALRRGVYTASAGNMAQGVAWCARELGVPCRVIVPEHAPRAKTDAIERFGGTVTKVPFDVWWQALVEHRHPGVEGLFIHPFADPAVMAGESTIAIRDPRGVAHGRFSLFSSWGGGLLAGLAADAPGD